MDEQQLEQTKQLPDKEQLWSPPAPKEDTPNLIMSLPPELRLSIWTFALEREFSLFLDPARGVPHEFHPRGILKVSKEIRNEALPVFCGSNVFEVYLEHIQLLPFSLIANWLNSIDKICPEEYQPFEGVKWFIVCKPPSSSKGRDNLSEWVSSAKVLAHAIYDTGIVILDKGEVKRYASLPRNEDISKAGELFVDNVAVSHEHKGLSDRQHTTYVQALQLGHRAYDEDWPEAEFDSVFSSFVQSWSNLDSYD